MKLWGGRFSGEMDPSAWDFNASIDFDKRLGLQDVRGSIGWARALERAAVISAEEAQQIIDALKKTGRELENGEFEFNANDEDIHTAVERRLGELIGTLAGKLHTGRSRNDQVATDLRLWLVEHLPLLDESIRNLQNVLVEKAESGIQTIIPGYTHLQRAQPILLAHWWLSYFWPLQRDRQRLSDITARTAVMPLGSAAMAGTPFPIDRAAMAKDLGFQRASQNSIDAVCDRDFAAEFLFCAALTGVHLSRLGEAIVIFSSAEFGFFELPDAFATGSSLMPQKKNPDLFELVRAKSGTLLGNLTGLMAVLKALPSAYDKDLQEDKMPCFSSYDTLVGSLSVLALAIQLLEAQPDKMSASVDAGLMATDLADYLVAKGVTFREAHAAVGQVVRRAAEAGTQLDNLPLEIFTSISPQFSADVYSVFDPLQSVSKRNTTGGTAPEAVAEQIKDARAALITGGDGERNMSD